MRSQYDHPRNDRMKKIILKRIVKSERGTFGVLIGQKGLPLCVTLEDPWNNNEKNISCIPEGTYRVKPHRGKKYKDTWILQNVPDRSAILIHTGNSQADTQGCILVGRSFNAHTIRDSRNAFEYLQAVLPSKFEIVIEDYTQEKVTEPSLCDRILALLTKGKK